jgi:hypothetical protein
MQSVKLVSLVAHGRVCREGGRPPIAATGTIVNQLLYPHFLKQLERNG